MTIYRLDELFPDELQGRLDTAPVLVLPFGTVEWHSSHLPLGLDGIVAQAIGERIADPLDAVLLPVSYYGAGGVPYPYTLKLPASIVEPLLITVFEQFGAMGFPVIVAFTGHFGIEQTLVLKRASLTVMERSPVTILPLTEYDLVTDFYKGDHAAVGETSIMLALRPDLVRLDSVASDQPLDGVLGADPRGRASAEYGERIMAAIASRGAEVANRLLRASPLDRAKYVDALSMAVRVLDKTFQQRQRQPKQAVPSVTTPAYLAYCDAMARGDYSAAKAHAERKLLNLAE